MTLIAVLIGFFLGGLLDQSGWGALSGAAIGFLLSRAQATKAPDQGLVARIEGLETHLRVLQRAQSRVVPEPASPVAREVEPVPPPPERVTPAPRPAPIQDIAPLPQPELASPPAAGPSAIEQAVLRLRELALGGNTLVRVGVLVLVVGVALLARWAAAHALFPIEARLAVASLIGVALTGLGYRVREARPGFGTTLQGGGLAALYVTVFSAFRIFALLPVGLSFGLFVAIALAGGTLAVLQRSQALIFIASLGGFLAPVLASTTGGNHVVLFGYYLVLNAAITAVAWQRSWRALNLLAFFCTYGVATLWGVLRYQPEHFATTEPFVLAYMLLFTGNALLFAMRQPPRLTGIVDATLVFGTPLLTLVAQSRLVWHMEFGLAYSSVGIGLFYALLASLLWRKAPETFRRLTEAFIALAVVFGTIAIPFAAEEGMTTAIAWALEGAGLHWIGTRQARRLPRYTGIALQLVAGALAGGQSLVAFALAAAGLFSARESWRARNELPRDEAWWSQLLAGWGLAWLAVGSIQELDRRVVVEYRVAAGLTLIGVGGLVLERLASALAWLPGRVLALAALPVAWIMLLVALETQPHLLAHAGFVAWPFSLAAIYAVLRRLESCGVAWIPRAYPPALWLVACVSSAALAGLADSALALEGDWPIAGFGVGQAAVLWIGLLLVERRIGAFGRHARLQFDAGLGPLVALALLWIVGANLLARGEAAPLQYLPLLNPVDLSLGLLALAIVSWGLRMTREFPALATRENLSAALALLGLIGFLWLNGLLVRTVHQWSGVPFRAETLWRSVELQVAFSIAWTLLALAGMLASTRRGWRTAWMVFAGLLGAVVAKLFLVDLSQLNAGARIISFLSVGAMVVAVGYLSPVPPSVHAEQRS